MDVEELEDKPYEILGKSEQPELYQEELNPDLRQRYDTGEL